MERCRRRAAAVALALVAVGGCAPQAQPHAQPLASVPAVAVSRGHVDLSRPVRRESACEYVEGLFPFREHLRLVGEGRVERAAVLATVVAFGTPRWNTRTGARPTSADADRMPVDPAIFTPVTLEVMSVYAGQVVRGQIVAFVRSGRVGTDSFAGCVLTRAAPPFTMWDRRTRVDLGRAYLVYFGAEFATGRDRGPLSMPEVTELLEVRGASFIDAGKTAPQPLG